MLKIAVEELFNCWWWSASLVGKVAGTGVQPVVIRLWQNVNKTSVGSWQGADRAVAACWYVSNVDNLDHLILYHPWSDKQRVWLIFIFRYILIGGQRHQNMWCQYHFPILVKILNVYIYVDWSIISLLLLLWNIFGAVVCRRKVELLPQTPDQHQHHRSLSAAVACHLGLLFDRLHHFCETWVVQLHRAAVAKRLKPKGKRMQRWLVISNALFCSTASTTSRPLTISKSHQN